MLISLVKYIRGFVKIQITGYSPERFINLCTSKKIFIWNIKEVSNGYSLYMGLDNYKGIKPLLKKTSTKTEVLEKHGLPFFIHKHRKRTGFYSRNYNVYNNSIHFISIHMGC